MKNEFSKAMVDRSDAELLAIVNEKQDDYQPQAVEAARTELESRNLNATEIDAAKKENEISNQLIKEKAVQELAAIWKIFAFLFPGFILFAFAGRFKGDGYERKAKDMTNWTLYGLGFYLALVVLMIIAVG